MSPDIVLTHQFVEFIPDDLKEGALYISIRFATVSHLCCCGCGNKVVTPIRPTDWKLIFDGKTISLEPSIGNWSFACQSHYWIVRNTVRWARQWSQEEIRAGRIHDALAQDEYFEATRPSAGLGSSVPSAGEPKESVWRRVKRWFLGY